MSSLSSVDSDDEKIFNATLPDNSKTLKKKEPSFEVVIDTKLSRAASGRAEYESFAEETKSTTENSEEEVKAGENAVESEVKEDDEEILPDHYYGGGKVPVFKPVSYLDPVWLKAHVAVSVDWRGNAT